MNQPWTTDRAWQQLLTGNRNFVAGSPAHEHQDAKKRQELVEEQTPFAAVFGCSDSRLAAEMIFDVGLGDLFVVRNAGQVLAETILGSLEFAVEVLKVPLIVVLGHDQCGAIKAGMSVQTGTANFAGEFIANLVNRITPTIEQGLSVGETTIEEFTSRHIRETVSELVQRSEIIREAVKAGKLGIVGAEYKLGLGEVQLAESLGISK
ncbi:MAG: carbonic anhydrase [Aquiluna sp.]|nr:carbonic anhydrase [Aquiluna sp.]